MAVRGAKDPVEGASPGSGPLETGDSEDSG